MKNTPTYLKNVVTLQIDQEKCVGCGMCTMVCPHSVFEITDRKADYLERNRCMECGACAKNCPVDAISVDAGVGCAQGIINYWLGKTDSPCCDPDGGGCC